MNAAAAALIPTALLLLAAVATGSGVLRLVRAQPTPVETLLFALLAGLGVQTTLLLGLSAAGMLQPVMLWAVVLLPAAAGAALPRQIAAAWRAVRSGWDGLGVIERGVAALTALGIGYVLLVGALVPVTDWDSLMYHVRIPRQFLEAGRLHFPADGIHVAFVGALHFTYLPLLAVGAEAGPALVNAALALALGGTVAATAARVGGPRAGALAGILLWASSSLLFVGVTPRVDVALTAALAITHLAALRTWDDEATWAFPLVGLLAGITAGFKYHALPYLAALVPVVLWGAWCHARRGPSRTGTMLRLGGIAAAMSVIGIAPWLLKNIALLGAPLWPFFTPGRIAPFLADITGSTAPPPGLSEAALDIVGRARAPISLEALFLHPEQLTVEGEGRLYTRNPLFYLWPLCLPFLRQARLAAVLLPGVAYLAVTLGAFAHTNLRYLLPALPMTVAGIVVVIAELARRSGRAAQWHPAFALMAGLAVLPALHVGMTRIAPSDRMYVATGVLAPDVILSRELPWLMARRLDSAGVRDARILMLFEARGDWFRQTVLQDNLVNNWIVLAASGATDRCLAGSGITHVMVNHEVVRYYDIRGLDLTHVAWDRWPAFASRCLEPVDAVRGLALYRLRADSANVRNDSATLAQP